MKIDGKIISSEILQNLAIRVSKLKKIGINPTMAIILMGDNKASATYVRQKEIKTNQIGAQIKLFKFGEGITNEKIEKLVKKLSSDPNIYGIILQRPAPVDIKVDELTELIPANKEIDGFGSKSKYSVPVAQAVFAILNNVYLKQKTRTGFNNWLESKKIVLIGKGETAGKPIIEHFSKEGIMPSIVDSKTKNKKELIKNADIVISSVGKKVINPKDIRKDAILISVGLYTDKEGRLKGDYTDEEIEGIASFYSPTPGGVGPVNVACLLENLIESAEASRQDLT